MDISTDATFRGINSKPSGRSNISSQGRQAICQARGLSSSHNTNTALIEIPDNAPHGLLLTCSNSECANSHRRFRYCKICDSVVAKQNFSRRHSHGLSYSSKASENILEYVTRYCDFVDKANRGHDDSMNLACMSESELTCFLEWMQDTDNMFS